MRATPKIVVSMQRKGALQMGLLSKRAAINWCFSLLAGAVLAASPAGAQDQTYLQEYKLYNQALEAGDTEAAAAHGRAAWQAAEESLGDNSLTAILAYNYGQLVLFSNTAEALRALKRADELQRAKIATLPPDELRLYLAYAAFAEGGGNRRRSRELDEALTEIAASGIKPNADLARMAFELAVIDLQHERYEEVIASSARAVEYLQIATPNDYKAIASALLVGGVAKLVPFPRKTENVIKAHTDFERGINLFSPQKDVESFDRTYAQLIAWSAAADAAAGTLGEDHSIFNSAPDDDEGERSPFFESAIGSPYDCGLEWAKRDPPDFPFRAVNLGYIGAAIIVYDIEGQNITNVRVLSEVPQEIFGKVAVRSMNKWEVKTPPVDHPGCNKNLVTQFMFVIQDR